jgi:hypothetical protein
MRYIDPSGHGPVCGGANEDPECDPEYEDNWEPPLDEEVVTPLESWADLANFEDPAVAVAARLLLAEMGDRLIRNQNWLLEGIGILWTVRNRIRWMDEKRLDSNSHETRVHP